MRQATRRVTFPVLATILRQPSGAVGVLLLALHLAVMLLAPLLVPHDPVAQNAGLTLSGPVAGHVLGTDHLGRDVFSRLLTGGHTAFLLTGLATLVAVAWGATVGMLAGYLGGLLDELVMRLLDAFQSMPWLLFMMLVVTILGNSPVVLVSVLAFCYGLPAARVARAATIEIADRDFVLAARTRGEGVLSILAREIWPNVRAVVLVDGAMQWSWMLLWFSSLSFLGLGVSPPNPDWGLMISDVRLYLQVIPLAAIAPMLALSSLIIAINLVADSLGKALGIDMDRLRGAMP